MPLLGLAVALSLIVWGLQRRSTVVSGTRSLTLSTTIALNDGNRIPQLGMGVYTVAPGEKTYRAVLDALRVGVRLIDTAQMYGNEADVGRAVRDSQLRRSDVWITRRRGAALRAVGV